MILVPYNTAQVHTAKPIRGRYVLAPARVLRERCNLPT